MNTLASLFRFDSGRSRRRAAAALATIASLLPLAPASALAEATASKPPEAILSVARTHSGPYVALATVARNLVTAGDVQNAALAAKALEVLWDRGEISFKSFAPAKWDKIDKSMDNFVKPITHASAPGSKAPEEAGVAAAYATFVENLKTLDGYYYH